MEEASKLLLERFYIPLGPFRTLPQAYKAYLAEYPLSEGKLSYEGFRELAQIYNWEQLAREHDKEELVTQIAEWYKRKARYNERMWKIIESSLSLVEKSLAKYEETEVTPAVMVKLLGLVDGIMAKVAGNTVVEIPDSPHPEQTKKFLEILDGEIIS